MFSRLFKVVNTGHPSKGRQTPFSKQTRLRAAEAHLCSQQWHRRFTLKKEWNSVLGHLPNTTSKVLGSTPNNAGQTILSSPCNLTTECTLTYKLDSQAQKTGPSLWGFIRHWLPDGVATPTTEYLDTVCGSNYWSRETEEPSAIPSAFWTCPMKITPLFFLNEK